VPDLGYPLPLLPLTSGVVLPGMVVTMALESAEALAAATSARSAAEGRLLLVPRIDGRFARVGTISVLEEAGQFPGGDRVLVVRGLQRATIGTAVPGTGDALWVHVDPLPDAPPTAATADLAR
jgi:ATP-dependent Lon protease